MKAVLLRSSILTYALPAFAFIFIACGGSADQGAEELSPRETDFIKLTHTSSILKTSYPGAIEGSVNVDIKAQVSGYIEAIYVKEGEYVQKGQALFKIKGDVFNEQINNTNAALQAALAAQANANLEIEKLSPLVEGKVVSDIQLKTAKANYQSATAQVAQAKAALGSSRINAAFALIKAPVSGYIGRIPNRVGNLVTSTDATPLTTLSDIDEIFVYFSISESDFISFRRQETTDANNHPNVELTLADRSLYEHAGKLEMASGIIDRTTGSITMKAVFPNPDKLLRSGGAGDITISRSIKDALPLPMTSVKDIQDKFFVFQLGDSNKVFMKPIEVAGNSGTNYLIKSGLQPGDKIAINRIDALVDGLVVIPKVITSDSLSN